MVLHAALAYGIEANKSAFPTGCIWLTSTQVLQMFEALLFLLFFNLPRQLLSTDLHSLQGLQQKKCETVPPCLEKTGSTHCRRNPLLALLQTN